MRRPGRMTETLHTASCTGNPAEDLRKLSCVARSCAPRSPLEERTVPAKGIGARPWSQRLCYCHLLVSRIISSTTGRLGRCGTARLPVHAERRHLPTELRSLRHVCPLGIRQVLACWAARAGCPIMALDTGAQEATFVLPSRGRMRADAQLRIVIKGGPVGQATASPPFWPSIHGAAKVAHGARRIGASVRVEVLLKGDGDLGLGCRAPAGRRWR